MAVIRKAEIKDIPSLKKIWVTIFGDGGDFLSIFFDELFPAATTFVAVDDDKIIGSAYVLEISSLKNGAEQLPCPYIYAVGVLPEFRGSGIGKQLVLASRDYCNEKYGISCLVPADKALHSYYTENAGYISAFELSEYDIELEGTINADISQISAADYGELREKLLSDIPHLCFDEHGTRFLESLCELFGGELYLLKFNNEFAVASCEDCENGLYIKELLCSDDKHRAFASALLWKLEYKAGHYRTIADKKHPESISAFGMLSKSITDEPLYFGPAFD